MNTSKIYKGTPTPNQLIRLQLESEAFLFIDGNNFVASLQHLKDSISSNTNFEIGLAQDEDFRDLKPVVILDENNNYYQTIGGGNYALLFKEASGEVIVTVT